MTRRAIAAAGILALWLAGLAALAVRESRITDDERMATMPLPVPPGAEYFAVMQGSRHIGYASSTIDTLSTGFEVTDFLVADLVADRATHRARVRVRSRLSRRLRLTAFSVELGDDIGPLAAGASIDGDTLLTIVTTAGSARADTQRIHLAAPVILPNLVPYAIALRDRPRVGREYHFAIFDPLAMAPSNISVRVTAESLFVVSDSARSDSVAGRWTSAHSDTVRAWKLEQANGTLVNGWIDDRGRAVETKQLGMLGMRRTAFEEAYQNWQIDRKSASAVPSDSNDIQEATAIAAAARIGDKHALASLSVRLRGVSPTGFDLDGDRQTLHGDTLVVHRETADQLRPSYSLPANAARFPAELADEPFVQSTAPEIVTLARRLAAGSTDPAVVAQRLTRWVHNALAKRVALTVPNALQTLQTRRGDCNEHTQLYLALARALGLPARSASGLAYVDGKFYYHVWPEVYLGSWVAVDPTFGEFPADAAHLRFVLGDYRRQVELFRLIGELHLDVLGTS